MERRAVLRRHDLTENFAVTAYLLLARAAIIAWVTLAVLPFEIAHDAIEAELERQWVEL